MINKKLKYKMGLSIIATIITLNLGHLNTLAFSEITIGGKDRIETSIKLAQKSNMEKTVILASGEKDKMIDSLVFGPLSYKLKAPIVLNTGKKLSTKVNDFFVEKNINKVIIAGGPNTISKDIESDLTKRGIDVKRIYGEDRFDTSLKVKYELGDIKGIFLIGRNSIPDAISVSSVAGIENHAIVIFDSKLMEMDIIKKDNIVIIGGEKSISNEVLKGKTFKRLSGKNRNETNKSILRNYLNSFKGQNIIVTTSEDDYLVDGLVAGPYASNLYSPIVFDKEMYETYIKDKKIISPYVTFIGNRIVNSGVKDSILKSNLNKEDKKYNEKVSKEKIHIKEITNEKKPNQDNQKESNKEIPLESTTGLPVRFDLRNINGKSYVTPVKNQYYDGGCRSFASLAALESHILIKEGITLDLSENNMENRHGFVFKGKTGVLNVREGRNRESDLSYLISGKGPILEEDDKYVPIMHNLVPASYLNEESKEELKKMNSQFKSAYTVQNEAKTPVIKNPVRQVYGFEFLKTIDNSRIASSEDILMKQIKEAIKNNGAVVSNIYMAHDGKGTFPYSNDKTYNADKKSYCTLDYSAVPNHAIAIVGWDDTFSKENFKEENRPDIDGAWIVKDAQTEKFGDKGYFYVSFKSSGICSDAYVYTDVRKPDEFKGVYQHDEYALTGFIKADKYGDKSILFNKYTITENNQIMDSVGFFTTKPNAEYEVYFIDKFDSYRKKLEQEELEDIQDVNDKFEKDKIKILSGNMEKAGYHTLKIPTEYVKELKKGDKIALGIYVRNNKTEDPNNQWDMVVEFNDVQNPNVNHGKNAVIKKDETFVLSNLMNEPYFEIMDLNGNIKENINACIKLYFK